MPVNAEKLKALGFSHQQFPDGWFWFIQPVEYEKAVALAQAMEFMAEEADDLPDTIILQCDDTFTNWSYVYGPEVGSLTEEDALSILRRLSPQAPI